MKLKLFETMQEKGWVFHDYQEFLGWLTTSEDLIDKFWGFLEDGNQADEFKNIEELSESLGFAIDLLKIINSEEK